jgi:hypothetical protein
MEQALHQLAATRARLCAPGRADSGRPDLGAQPALSRTEIAGVSSRDVEPSNRRSITQPR